MENEGGWSLGQLSTIFEPRVFCQGCPKGGSIKGKMFTINYLEQNTENYLVAVLF